MGFVRDYFSFSKRERVGAIVLVILSLVIFLLPEFIPSSRKVAGLEILSNFSSITDSFNNKTDDSSSYYPPPDRFRSNEGDVKEMGGSGKPARLFAFDPNTIALEGWMELGISERTAHTIQKFLSKGGSFKKPEDIGKIYGLSRLQYDRLLPYVRIRRVSAGKKPTRNEPSLEDTRQPTSPQTLVDINTADTILLIALPGIGSKLANRIIHFRNRLGGFHSLDQLREVYGLPDSTFEQIRPLLSMSSPVIQKINLNQATAEQLKAHPYLKWNIANAIINYRTQHGPFAKLEDLLAIDIITPEMVERIRPYLEVD